MLAVLISLLVAIGLATACYDFWKWQKEYRRRRVNKKMLTELKKFGPLFVINKMGGVTAVCARRAFNSALTDWRRKVTKNPETEWGKPVFRVQPTFTFTSDDVPFCTGNRENVESIAVDLIYFLLDRKYDKLTIRKAKNLGEIIVKEDSRLYVPFVGDMWQPEWQAYRYSTVVEACNVFYREVHEAVLNTKAK